MSVNLTHREGQQLLEVSHLAHDNVLGADLKKEELKMTWSKIWKEGLVSNQMH